MTLFTPRTLGRLSLLTGLLLFCGCNRSTTPPPAATATSTVSQPAPQSAATTPDSRPLLVCFGDSLTAGYGADPGETYPDYLQQDLDAAGYHYRVVNEGISGNTTTDGLARLPRIIAMKPALVILELGGNDGLRGQPVALAQKNLDAMLAQLKAAKIPVVLGGITLPPNYGADYVSNFITIYPALAKKYHTPLLGFVLDKVYGIPGSMQEDGIHATAQGNQQVAKNFLPYITPLLQHD
ncbi:MAG TPA: arylesterase [Acidobacteriaceae bacterium]